MSIQRKLPAPLTFLLTGLLTGLAALTSACESEGYESILIDEVELGDALEAELEEPALELEFGAPAPLPTSGTSERRGRVDFGTFSGTKCAFETFDSAFNSAEGIQVQASVDHRQPGSFDAVTVWVEDLTTQGVELCVRETSQFNGNHTNEGLHVSYWAYRSTGSGIAKGRAELPYIPANGSQRVCATVSYGQDFGLAPLVHATITHPYTGSPYTGQTRDASSLWLEWITSTQFRVCMRETASGTAGHVAFAIDWVAFLPGDEPNTSDSRSGIIDLADYLAAQNGGVPVSSFEDQICVPVSFESRYAEVPDVFLAADHTGDPGNHQPATTWIEKLDEDGFRACFKELSTLADPGGNHENSSHTADMFLQWTALAPS